MSGCVTLHRNIRVLLVVALVVTLAATAFSSVVVYTADPGYAYVPGLEPYLPIGSTLPIPDFSAYMPGYAFAQVPDSTPPTFVSSDLNISTGALSITFSENIDATPKTKVDTSKIHIRESGTYTGGVTLTAAELGTTADGSTISFTLTAAHRMTVAGLTTPELTIDPGAVRDTSGNLIDGTFDVSTRTFVDATSVSAQETTPQDIEFSNDGLKMFVIGTDGDAVNEYTLSAAFDASTRTFVSNTTISAQESTPHDIEFSNDGLKMFVIGTVGDDVNEYTLSAAFDASTRTFVDATTISAQETIPHGMAFSNDGLKMFVIGTDGTDVNEYTLSAAFDASTRTFVDATSISAQETQPKDLTFSNDGRKMFVIGDLGDDVNEYTLSAAFDASTRTFVDATLISSQEDRAKGMAFSNDGAKMFVIGSRGDDVNEYTLSSVYPITLTSTQNPPTDTTSFITTWRTASTNQTVTIPGTGTYTVDWGDGSTPTSESGTATHEYADADAYTVSISGGLTRIHLDDSASNDDNDERLRSIEQWGDIEWSSMNGAFWGASNMVYNATDAPDLSGVTDMTNMFRGASSFNGNVSGWNVSSVTDMNSMFHGATVFNGDLSEWDISDMTSMVSIFRNAIAFNQDLSDWDISGVTNMADMFYGASSFNGNISKWDTSGVVDMTRLFRNAIAFNQDISKWDTSSVDEMQDLFRGASTFNQDISGWNVTQVGMDFGSMTRMFDGADNFDQNLGKWYVVANSTTYGTSAASLNVTAISAQNSVLDGHDPVYGVDSGDSHDSELFSMINNSTLAFKAAPSAGTYTANVTASGSSVFENGNNWDLITITVTGEGAKDTTSFITTWQTTGANQTVTIPGTGTYTVDWGDGSTPTSESGIATHEYTDADTYTVSISGGLERIHLRDSASDNDNDERLRSIEQWGDMEWDNMSLAFLNAVNMAYNATDAPDLSDVTDMRGMFWGASAFDGDLSGWDVSGVTDMNRMFSDTTAFNGNISGWDVSGVTDMSNMFSGATAFDGDLSSWDTTGVTDMNGMFFNARAFDQDLSSWDTSKVTNMNGMFTNAYDFNGNITGWDTSKVTNMVGMFFGATAFDGDLSSWDTTGVTDMNRMFSDTTTFNQNLSDWDTSDVTSMSNMFTGATAFNGNITGWDVSDVIRMNSMFSGATAFNGNISGWNVSSVATVANMFNGATSFQQNLGKWYVVPDSTTYDTSAVSLNVTAISAQNSALDGHDPMYGVDSDDSHDSELFSIINNNTLAFKAAPSAGTYTANVTASGDDVFENGNNWNLITITVTGEGAKDTTSFITTWQTTSADQTVTIPGTGTYTVDWGDGSTPTSESGIATHEYTDADTYTVSISGGLERIHLGSIASNDDNDDRLRSIEQWGNMEWDNMSGAFRGASNMMYNATDAPDLSDVTDMTGMFRDATAFDGDLSEWNVSGVTDMNSMFRDATAFDGDISEWNVSGVINMANMFTSARAFNQDLTSWDTSKVTNMANMFTSARAFHQDLTSWDTSKVTDMSSMFRDARAFDDDISNWDVSAVTDMDNMFNGAAAFNQDISEWNVSAVSFMTNMFSGATSFQQNLGKWYVVPDDTLIARSAIPGIVGEISAQNGVLAGHNPVYGIGDSDDSDHFTISGNRINMISSDTGQTSYALTVTASGSSVFENGRNSHAFTVTVTDRSSDLPPIFISSALDSDTGTLEITFSEAMDVTPATNVVLAKIHIRESGNYTGGVNLNATELDSTADGATISFTLTAEQLTAVAGLSVPELTIEPGAVRDVSGSLIESSFDASTAVTAGSASVSGQDNLPRGIALSANGTKMFIVGGENYAVSEYAMSTPFDISTLDHVDSTSISANTTTPQDLAFSDDGTKMFVLESSGRRIHEYTLSTPFDASTLTYNDSTYVSSQERQPRGMAFSNDGAKMFVTGWHGDDINEYTLSTAFDVSTLAHVDATSISDEENNPTGMAFSNDGTKMFVVGGSGGGQINAYDLSAPFDTSTLAHIYTASVMGARLPEGVAFSNDGTKMFVVDSPNEKVFQYTLSSVYPIMLSSVQDPPADATSFVTTWQTTSAGESVIFPGTGTYTINWGDGTTDTDVTGPQTHEYASAGTYTVSVSGGLTAVTLGDSTSNAAKLQSIDQWGDIGWTTMNRAFQDASFMTYRATDAPDLSQVTDMRLMFDDAYIFNGNLSSWDVSGVTDMSYMFWIAREFNGDLSGWDVSSVTNMTSMFNGASAFNQPLSSWDTSSVTVMDSMFAGASLFNQPLSLWDTSSVTDMSYMFSGASLFNQTLSSWDTSSVTRMDSMFRSASAFNQPLSSWDVSGVTDMNYMFSGASAFNQPLSSWDTSSVTDMSRMFRLATEFNYDLSGWDVSSVTDMTSMFNGASAFNQPLSSWGTSSVTRMSSMFSGASAFNQPLTSWNTSSVTDMSYMFNGASAFNQPLSLWDTSSVTDMDGMFNAASLFNQPLSSWDTSSVTDMSYMFYDASAFNGDISGWDVSGVTAPENMDEMFFNAGAFDQNLGKWYIVASSTSIVRSEVPGTVGEISAQNSILDDHSPTYGIGTGGNSTRFAMHDGDKLNMTSAVPGQDSYTVNVTASGSSVFEDGNNWRVLNIIVGVSANNAPVANAGLNLSVDEGGSVALQGSGSDDDGDTLTYSWSEDSRLTFDDRTSATPTVTASFVTADTPITLTLTVDDGTVSAEDTMTLTIRNLNNAPVANAGPNLSVDEGGSVRLQGSGSDDDAGDTLTYSWSGDSRLTFDNHASATPTVTASSVTADTPITLTLTVDDGTASTDDTMTLTIRDVTPDNLRPTVSVGPNQTVREGAAVSMPWTAVDPDGDTLTYLWSQDPATPAIFLGSERFSPTTFIAPQVDADTVFTLTLQVTAGPHTVQDSLTVTVKNNRPPAVDAGQNRTFNEGAPVTLRGTANDPDGDPLTYEWAIDSRPVPANLIGINTTSLQFTAPGVASDGEIVFRFTATDDADESAEDTVTITVRNVPITVSSAVYNPGNGQLVITFNQDIDTVDYSGLHVRSSANLDTGGITLSSVTDRSDSGRTITATLDPDQQDQYDALQSPRLVTDGDAVTDTDGDTTTNVSDFSIRDASSRKKSSSSSPPAVDLGALVQQKFVDIPPHIAEQMASRDDSDPLEPLIPDDTFEFPLVINGYGYLLDDSINTLVPQTVTAGNSSVTITFTVYTEKDLAHFALYLNLQDDNTDYVDSDTYIMYKDYTTTVVTDPHGYIADATITVTQDDDDDDDDHAREKKTVHITIYFDEPMGSTNMVAYMWNTDRKTAFVRVIDALEVVTALPSPPQEPVTQTADPEPVEPDSVLPVDPEPMPADTVWPGDYDEAQVLSLIRMWSGFESETITDEQLLASLGLDDDDDYPDADIPDWVMTDLGVLVAKGDVTVNEFVLALQYVLEYT